MGADIFCKYGPSKEKNSTKKSSNVRGPALTEFPTSLDEPKSVNVFHDVVIYSLDPLEDNQKLIRIVYLNKDYSERLVVDFSKDDRCMLYIPPF